MKKNLAAAAALILLAFTGVLFGNGYIHFPSASAAGDPVIAGAGDITGSSSAGAPTANLLASINPDAVFTLGDNAYEDGSLAQYQSNYAPTWGQFNSKVNPATGNHEYHTANAQGYLDYFGKTSPYYSYDIGAWHIIVLASDAGISNSAGGAEETWLKTDLAANPGKCIAAMWHEPKYTSGDVHGNDSSWAPVWTDLYNAGAAVVLNGHNHEYERFAPQSPSGAADANGIREFVVGTGGWGLYGFGTPKPNSEVRYNGNYGVLKLTLHPTGYDFQFINVANTVVDSGSGTCPGVSQPPPTSSTTTTVPSTTSTTSSTVTTTPPPGNVPPHRFMFFTGTDPRPAQWGFNLYDTGDGTGLPPGTQASVFLGTGAGWDDATCSWDLTDAQVTTLINNTKNDPGVYDYFYSDEPNPFQCPNAIQAHKDRVALIRSLTSKPTVMVIDSNRGQETLDQIPMWVGVSDYANLDVYPCYQSDQTTCRFAYEQQVIDAANAAGLVYWGGVQAFADTEFRWPTASELQHQLDIWSASAWQGMMLFAFSWAGNNLSDHPDLVSVLQNFNAGGSSPPPTTSTTTTTTPITSTTTPSTTSTTTPTTTVADTEPPSVPTNLRIEDGTKTSLTLIWDPSTDNVAVTGYRVWRNGNLLSLQAGTQTMRLQVSLKCSTDYKYEVAAFDAAGNMSARSVPYTAVCTFH